MRRPLLCALLTPAVAYFILIAVRPAWLMHGTPPWSITLALSLIWYGFAITILYTLFAKKS